jgi:inner membrane protein
VTTIITHPALAVATGLGLRNVVPTRLMLCGMVGSILPDLDVIAFRLGIAYGSEFGHRGFSHSLLFAFGVALLGACLCRWLKARFGWALLYLFVSVASHGILDAFTDGGMGVALLWPFDETRYFAPFHPIEVSPLGLSRFLGPRGIAVLKSELLWVWLPALGLCLSLLAARRLDRRHRA